MTVLIEHMRARDGHMGRWIEIPPEKLNGAGSVVLARRPAGSGYQPFAVRLPHQVYVKDLPDLLGDSDELWALPVGVPAKWVQIANRERA